MASERHRAEYERRMHRVLAHIDRHLDAPLDLKTLAEVAHFSPFHFHRLFAASMGETLGDYLRRRRLEVGALRLLSQPSSTVLEVALTVGFGSAEAFAHAFQARFGCSATAWRRRHAESRKADQAGRNRDQVAPGFTGDAAAVLYPHPEQPVNVTLVDRRPVTIAYLRHVGPYGEPVLRFWQQVVYPWMVTNGLLGLPRYGMSPDDPSITAPERCRYDAGVEVPPGTALAGAALEAVIPGGRYAVLPFEGTTDTINGAWTALLRDWLPASGLQLDARPCFEHYPTGSRFDPATGVFDCEICVPVAPL